MQVSGACKSWTEGSSGYRSTAPRAIIALGAVLRYPDDPSVQLLQAPDTCIGPDHDSLARVISRRCQDHRISAIDTRPQERRRACDHVIEVAGDQRLNQTGTAVHENRVHVQAMLLEDADFSGEQRDEQKRARSDVSDHNLLALL